MVLLSHQLYVAYAAQSRQVPRPSDRVPSPDAANVSPSGVSRDQYLHVPSGAPGVRDSPWLREYQTTLEPQPVAHPVPPTTS